MPTALLCVQGGARELSQDPEETDALDALGSLATFAGCAASGSASCILELSELQLCECSIGLQL